MHWNNKQFTVIQFFNDRTQGMEGIIIPVFSAYLERMQEWRQNFDNKIPVIKNSYTPVKIILIESVWGLHRIARRSTDHNHQKW